MTYSKLTADRREELQAWVQLWLAEAATAGFITAPYTADDETLQHALELHDFGLDPIDAAFSIFGLKHWAPDFSSAR